MGAIFGQTWVDLLTIVFVAITLTVYVTKEKPQRNQAVVGYPTGST